MENVPILRPDSQSEQVAGISERSHRTNQNAPLSIPAKHPWSCRAVLFRIGAILLAIVPVLLLELCLIVLDLGRPENSDDPFVGFSSVRPLFVRSDDGSRYEIPRSRLTHFAGESFAAEKEPGEFRIFCVGDSTVQGNPYSIETAFTTWLGLSLRAADPSRHWEVVNCGGISYASYRMVPILEELLAYEPDLFIVHSSHNEFLEDRTYGDIKRTPRMITRVQEAASQSRSFNVLRGAYLRINPSPQPLSPEWRGGEGEGRMRGKAELAAEVEALLDYQGGMEFYHRDETWRNGVIAHFETNLRRMVRIARGAHVPIILMNPVSNLRDSPPFKSEHRAGLSDAELEQWDSLWTSAREFYNGRHREAVPLLLEAIAIDDQHAGIHYDLGKCYDVLGQVAEAHREYMAAKELDICPLRILESMNQIVLDVSHQTGTSMVDVRELIGRLSRNGIPGSDWLVDHVHPSIRGHQTIANELADNLVQLGIVRPVETWKPTRDELYAEHLRSLDALYFAKGQQHLEGLMTWAQGRTKRERPKREERAEGSDQRSKVRDQRSAISNQSSVGNQ